MKIWNVLRVASAAFFFVCTSAYAQTPPLLSPGQVLGNAGFKVAPATAVNGAGLNVFTPEQFYQSADAADWGLAINRAMVALSALSGGGTLKLACGTTYSLGSYSSNALSAILAFSNVNIHGCGPSTILKLANGVNTSSAKFIYGIAGAGATVVSNVRYDGFTFDMNGVNNSCSGTCYAPNAVISIRTGDTIFLDNITFINNPGSNDTVFGTIANPPTVSNLHLTNLHHNNYGDRVNAASSDFSADFVDAKNYVMSNITYDNGPSINGAAFEVHGDGGTVSNLEVNNNFACGIIANNAVAPLTQNINLSTIKCNNVQTGVVLFSFAAASLANINISNVTVNFLTGVSGTGIDACIAMNSASGPNTNLNVTGVIVKSTVQTNLGNNTSGIWACYWRSANVQNNQTFNTQGPGVRFSNSVANSILTASNNQIIEPGFTTTTALQAGIVFDATAGITADTITIENNAIQGTVAFGIIGAQNTSGGTILGNFAPDAGGQVNWTGTGFVPVPFFPTGAYHVLASTNNLSDLASAATSRTNLGVTATGADTTYNFRANNLSDVASAATARTNLGLTATGADTTYNFRANNLSDVANAATARTNLGLANFFSVANAVLNAAPANPTGTASTTAVMMGLGSTCHITPVNSSRVEFVITGYATNNTGGDGAAFQLAYGTGTAPANAASASGTTFGSAPIQAAPLSGAGAFSSPFTLSGIATGLTIGTAVWFDPQVKAVTGGTASILSLTCTAHEV